MMPNHPWHPGAPSGTNGPPWATTGHHGPPLAPPDAYASGQSGANGCHWSPVVIKDPHAQDIAAQGGPRRPCLRVQSDHLSSILGSLSARNCGTPNACTEDRRHWSPLCARVRPCAPIKARTPWHLLAPSGTDGRSWALRGDPWATARMYRRMSAYRGPAPLVLALGGHTPNSETIKRPQSLHRRHPRLTLVLRRRIGCSRSVVVPGSV